MTCRARRSAYCMEYTPSKAANMSALKIPGFTLLNLHLAILCGTLTAILPASLAQDTLTSSVQQAGRQAACPRETVIFTCNVLDDFALQWIAGNHIPSTDPISFLPNSQTDTISRGDFTATLVSAIRNPNNSQRARFRSQLTVTVVEGSSLNGTQVTCNRQSVDLIVSSQPISPSGLQVIIKDQQTGPPIPTILQWKRSEDIDVDCYNITVSSVISRDLYTVIVCSGMTSVQLLLLNGGYSANLTASNLCNQVSNATRLEFTVEAPVPQTTEVIPAPTLTAAKQETPFPIATPTSSNRSTTIEQANPSLTATPTFGSGTDRSAVVVAGVIGGVLGVVIGTLAVLFVGIVVCTMLRQYLFKRMYQPSTDFELVKKPRKES